MAVKHLYNYDKAVKTGCAPLVKWVDAQYAYFCAWILQQGPSFLNSVFPEPSLQITSYGKREGTSASHSKNLAIDISCMTIVDAHIQKEYIALFGLWLQKKNKNLCHVAISIHNKHLHIDSLPERKGNNDMEIKISEDHYDFKPINMNLIYENYQFEDVIKDLSNHIDEDYIQGSDTLNKISNAFSFGKYIILAIAAMIIYSFFKGGK